jgi:hypothetical protein
VSEAELPDPTDLPAWVSQPDMERVEWLNTIIAQASSTYSALINSSK